MTAKNTKVEQYRNLENLFETNGRSNQSQLTTKREEIV